MADSLKLDDLLRMSIWRDGAVLSPEQATVSVWEHAFLYGDGVFEGVRVRDGRLYRIDLHLERLRRSSRLLGLELRYGDDEILAGIAAAADANGLSDAHVRIVHSRGVGLPGIDPRRCPQTSLTILVYPFPPLLGTEPLTLIVSSIARKAPRSVPAAAKSLNYLDSVLAKQQAIAAGAGDALMLDAEGHIAEATGANLFVVRDGTLRTPPIVAALPGITRRTILELAGSLGVATSVESLTTGDLLTADEAFLTGTAAGIVPIGAVDGVALPAAPGPLTRELDAAYRTTWSHPDYTRPIR